MKQNFTEQATRFLSNVNKQLLEIDEAARIELDIEKRFDEALSTFLNKNVNETDLCFYRSVFGNEPCNYDIRQCMDDERINEVAKKGYRFILKTSTPEKLYFIKCFKN